jgi:hypothetical protein
MNLGRSGFGLAGVTVCALLAFTVTHVAAQSTRAVVEAEAKRTEKDGREVIQVDVLVRNVEDLGAFEFVLTFDGDILKVGQDSVVEGPFLGSSGRQTYCPEPTIDNNALRYACVTLGPTPREGAKGEGLLASVFFEPKGGGEASIEFTRAQLATPPGERIDAEWRPGKIALESGGRLPWWAWALIGVGGVAWLAAVGGTVAALLLRRSRLPSGLPSG